tara:strand:+ start:632 stop:1090 length:459 start_codon:yes stop_codon:yes gene_type:complete
MNKVLNYIFIFSLFVLLSCDYKPILSDKNYKFSVNVNKLNGDEKINTIIINNFYYLKEKEKKYDLDLSTIKEKNIISKDSKGDPSVFELIIKVNYIVKKDGKTLIVNNINRKTTYNNIADKFELESYEKNIISNLARNISDKIISSISEINE